MSSRVLQRQLRYLKKASRRVGKASAKLDGGFTVDMLPTNPMLESAIANTLAHNKDGRTMLDFTRHFLHSNLLSLASPVGPWDPYDVKPQVFALDTFIALPVFTSVGYLQHFCSSFNFTVRDPSGNLWACPSLPKLDWPSVGKKKEEDESPPRADASFSSDRQAEKGSDGKKGSEDVMDADRLYDILEDDTPCNTKAASTDEKGSSSGSARSKGGSSSSPNQKGGKKTKKKKKKIDPAAEQDPEQARRNAAAAANFWNTVSSVPTFGIRKATPLPSFGPFIRPYFVGYFADVETLLSSTSIVPEKVDVVLNPQSPLELVLAREMTDRVLHRRELVRLCYAQVEKELKGEFHRFFLSSCPEVKCAYSVCMPEQVSDLMPKNEIPYRILMAIESRDFHLTWQRIRQAKHAGQLLGHVSLTIIPYSEATDVARGMFSVFYDRPKRVNPAETSEEERLGVFTAAGPVATIDLRHDASSFYHDPTNTYTESHSIFTDMLKYSGPDLSG